MITHVWPNWYDAPDTFEVEGIIDHRGTGSEKEYLVKWVGYRIETWLGSEGLHDSKETVDKYNLRCWEELEPESEENENEKE